MLELVPFLRTEPGLGEDLGPFFGHEQSMFKLGRQFRIASAYGPSILFVERRIAFADVDHWFDREADAGIESVLSRLTRREMGDRRLLMEAASQAMSDVFTDDREATFFGDGYNRFSDL